MAYSKEEKAAYDKAYREENKERRSAYNKAWNEANKAVIAVRARAYREANKEKIATYKIANKDKIKATLTAYREANKEKNHAYRGAWREANMSRFAAYSSKRRALKLKLIPKHLKNCPVEKQRVLDIFKLRSLISKATGVKHHVDHMWPVSDGGPEWSGNMQIITAQENLSKHAKLCPEIKRNIKQSLKELENVFQ